MLYMADRSDHLCGTMPVDSRIVAELQVVDSLGRVRKTTLLGVYRDGEDFVSRGPMSIEHAWAGIKNRTGLTLRVTANKVSGLL